MKSPWAKLERVPPGAVPRRRLSLVEHSADVAAVFEAMLCVGAIRDRLARLAGRARWPAVWTPRLATHVALHDFGKVNHGFQSQDHYNRGHVGPGIALLYGEHSLAARLVAALPFEVMHTWGEFGPAIQATAAHHGRPINFEKVPVELGGHVETLWSPGRDGYDPIAALKPLADAVHDWFPLAFEPGGEPLPEQPTFWHAFAGLVMLADWIGSDTNAFPLREPDAAPEDRMARARAIAPRVLRDYGFDPADSRNALPRVSFKSVSEHDPRAVQTAVADAEGQIVILEAETGSGKTEAALYRFAKLFEAGTVDGLYFALPTRVAAKSLYDRIRVAVARMFPDESNRPAVILAVPGYARVDGATARPLPGFDVQWDDDPSDAERRRRWAAERPKRFLAGTIAVGTIDQALLGGIKVKHAHMRASCLQRHLLVVDEVHASDIYMETLLTNVLQQHTRAGGHALLLSATLGVAARLRLLGSTEPVPALLNAISADYPAVSTSAAPVPRQRDGSGRTKRVELRLDPSIADPARIAGMALEAARCGAKVLVVRNLHRTAVATAQALFAMAPDDPTLFTCNGVPTLHHGRFAREDRELLDGSIEVRMKEDRGRRGLVLVGTQTLEQSLDICADLLITDLAPSDVLLQRLGRLHRHAANDCRRPPGFEAPRAVILSPIDLASLLGDRGDFGMGGKYGPYRDLIMLEATRRLVEQQPVWRIPEMNRQIVEMALHPEARERLTRKLEQRDPAWRKNRQDLDGNAFADISMARSAILPWSESFDSGRLSFGDGEESYATRLGARDIAVELPAETPGPFGSPIRALSIPHHWSRGIEPTQDVTPRIIEQSAERLVFVIQQRAAFKYDRFGLGRHEFKR